MKLFSSRFLRKPVELIRGAGGWSGPVSYTHLDVYKRQDLKQLEQAAEILARMPFMQEGAEV